MNPTRPVVSLVMVASLVAQGDLPSGRPGDPLERAWRDALAMARKHKAPLLAFVLPPAGAPADPGRVKATWEHERAIGMTRALREEERPAMTARELLLRQVQMLRLPECQQRPTVVRPSRGQAVFALSVPVLAPASACGAEPGETVVLLGPDGRRVRGFAIDLLDAEKFLRDVGSVVLDPVALAARAANVPADVARDVAAVPFPVGARFAFVDDQQLRQRLVDNLCSAAPALVKWVDGDLQLHHVLWSLEEDRPPLGTEPVFSLDDLCMGCGMGFTPPGLTDVLKLIGP